MLLSAGIIFLGIEEKTVQVYKFHLYINTNSCLYTIKFNSNYTSFIMTFCITKTYIENSCENYVKSYEKCHSSRLFQVVLTVLCILKQCTIQLKLII